MAITVNKTTACSHAELSGVGSTTPEKAIEDICKFAMKGGHYTWYEKGIPYSFYIFSESVVTKDGAENYGDKLATYIREKGLGSVVETPAMVNQAFHPDHSNKVFVWVVDHVGVGKWYKEFLRTNPEKTGFQLPEEDYNDILGNEVKFDDDDNVGGPVEYIPFPAAGACAGPQEANP